MVEGAVSVVGSGWEQRYTKRHGKFIEHENMCLLVNVCCNLNSNVSAPACLLNNMFFKSGATHKCVRCLYSR